MRRIFHMFFLAILLIAAILPISVEAQALDSIQLAASSSSAKMGETLSVTVAGKSLSDLYGAEIELAYDAAKLQYDGYSSPLTGQAFIMEPTSKDGKIMLVFTFTGQKPGLNGDANLFAISFKAIGTGEASVSLNTVTGLNHQGQPTVVSMGNPVTTTISNNNTVPPVTNPGTDKPLTPGVVTVEASPSDKGVVSIRVTPKDLLAAAESSKDRSVRIQVNKVSDAKEVLVNLPVADWRQAGAQTGNIDTIKLETELANVTIDTKMLRSIQVTDPANLQLRIAKVDPAALPSGISQVVGTGVVYDFTITLDGQKITNFSDKEVMVELPYVLSPGENPNQVVIYYLTTSGNLEVVKNGYYNATTGKVAFKPSHFSQYTAKHVPVSFQDMNGYGWASDAVLGLAAREVIQGRSEGNYVPDGQVTRAEFVQMLTKLFDLSDISAATVFTDVAPGAWYYKAIASAQKAGLVQGKDDGSFGVNDLISREDMAVLIDRFVKQRGLSSVAASGTISPPADFLDLGLTSAYARDAVSSLQQAGIMNGMTEGYFEPKGNSTRAQAASVLYRLYQAIQ
ncbi:hypothetical protein A8709_15065 [Paenibacillus pectinilyticus]|uniref:SLH domain-containing protein n=1 Tax=Paenibacillus pectinilyticus TaxID=512399 RepID=A0A1C1A4B7_9BACL|nr:S-layer homology domain-containing protein [Paenibacillus pectinilyticus]OCT15399.1 hypothetical protein A8709_15065 [Paenibacillus pectinilyticus]